jgi:hypothetical protein
MTTFLIILAVCLVIGCALMVYHLAHAPVGEQTPEGFKETSRFDAAESESSLKEGVLHSFSHQD